MHAAGGISKRTMREYDELCVPAVPKYTKTTIIKIRKSVHVSQGVLAAYLNTSASTVQKWEAGTKKPSGAAAKLLQVIEKHGLAVLA
ncbi:helix-turn-helix domain-containing protein [Pandoraea sp. NPDC090278]|uniref:helix-turn-helix domain-containing protein n=1 Tax=Pandoraea sp. NPDC090278 TaxID=3364391 RepID=UPI00383B40D1